MTQIVVPVGFEQPFLGASEAVEVRATNGELLGLFVPTLPSEYENAQPDIDDAELQRRFAEGGGRTLKEIWADLREKQG